jgi:hypothetical protein
MEGRVGIAFGVTIGELLRNFRFFMRYFWILNQVQNDRVFVTLGLLLVIPAYAGICGF